MKRWPEKIDVFMSVEQKEQIEEICKRLRVPKTEAGRVAFAQFIDRYKNRQPGESFP